MVNNTPLDESFSIYDVQDSTQYIEIRPTPWNDAVLGMSSCELIDACSDTGSFQRVMDDVKPVLTKRCYGYIQTRVEGNRSKRQILEGLGFYFSELSYALSFNKPQKYSSEKLLKHRLTLTPVKDEAEIAFIKHVAYDDFHYGRLLEDIKIDTEVARQRTSNWIDTLCKSPFELLIAKHGDNMVGFHAQRCSVDGRQMDWILTGTAARYSMLSVPLWQAAFALAQVRKCHVIKTLISAANVSVLNLYSTFPFRVDKALYGYHRLSDK